MGDGGKVKEDLSLVALVRDASVPVLRIQFKLDSNKAERINVEVQIFHLQQEAGVCVCGSFMKGEHYVDPI